MDPFNPTPNSPNPATLSLPQPIAANHHHNPPLPDMINAAPLPPQAPPAPAVASRRGLARRKQGRPQKLILTPEPNLEACMEPMNVANGVSVEPVVVPEKRAVLIGPSGYPKRSRGRPPKSRLVAEMNDGPVKALAIVGVKRRMRQKSSQGREQAALVPKRIGWRPNKKVGSRVLGPSEPQWMVDYAHVRVKLDYMQTQMKNAIEVLKPYLMANGHLSRALQELNQISTMDIMAVSLSVPVEEPAPTAGPHFY